MYIIDIFAQYISTNVIKNEMTKRPGKKRKLLAKLKKPMKKIHISHITEVQKQGNPNHATRDNRRGDAHLKKKCKGFNTNYTTRFL